MLTEELAGYDRYVRDVPWRLVPEVWSTPLPGATSKRCGKHFLGLSQSRKVRP